MAAYYNEIDAYAAQWLRNLIAAGHIAPGDVDERSIVDVRSDDLTGYNQCHFFAGVGGWSLALRLAMWPDDRPVWTGSCPCQPFSVAGKKTGQSDERHLWPHWFGLIRECKPPTIFGEQVANAIAQGWWDDAAHELEAKDYACAAAVLPACSVHAPHKRDRLWFVAHSHCSRGQECGEAGRGKRNLPRPDGQASAQDAIRPLGFDGVGENGSNRLVAYPDQQGSQGHRGLQECADQLTARTSSDAIHPGWESEPSVGRVANGIPARVGKLRAFGNAIVPQVAAEFIKATM